MRKIIISKFGIFNRVILTLLRKIISSFASQSCGQTLYVYKRTDGAEFTVYSIFRDE
ncbi:MAG: hypothetical protein QOE96_1471 [Blastocatellia bacterium]|jgi:hypothetical protein|nr:hypothetical protein [Blastocatellia bacterium]